MAPCAPRSCGRVPGVQPASSGQIYKELRKDDYLRALEADVRRQIPGAVLSVGKVGEDAATNRFELTMTLQAPRYAQVVQGRLMIVRPPQMNRLDLPTLTAPTRHTPILLEPLDERDILELALPAETAVDELPEPRSREAPFGSFAIRWQLENGRVTRSLSLRLHRTSVAPASYNDVRTFLDAFREAERLPVVLVKR